MYHEKNYPYVNLSMIIINPQIQENINLFFVFLKHIKNHFFYIFFVKNAQTHIQNHIFVFLIFYNFFCIKG
jgi:hypothetical protein